MEESAGNICYGSRAIHIYVVPTHESVLGVEEHAVTEVVLAADGHGAQHRVQLQQEEAVRGHQHPAAVPALGPGLGHQLGQELVTDPIPDIHHGLATVGETPGQQLSVLDELLHLNMMIMIYVRLGGARLHLQLSHAHFPVLVILRAEFVVVIVSGLLDNTKPPLSSNNALLTK